MGQEGQPGRTLKGGKEVTIPIILRLLRVMGEDGTETLTPMDEAREAEKRRRVGTGTKAMSAGLNGCTLGQGWLCSLSLSVTLVSVPGIIQECM